MCGQDFILLREASSLVRRVVGEGRIVGEGAFARVYAIDSRTVLKLTTCQATQALFDRLLHKPVAGMVKVLKAFGPVVEDEDGMVYSAYIVERLYSQDEWQSLPDVVRVKKKQTHKTRFFDRNGKRRKVCTQSAVRAPKRRRLVRRTEETLEAAVYRIKKPIRKAVLTTANGRQAGGELFWKVKRIADNSVTAALRMLQQFTLAENAELDLLVPGNIMLTREGTVCLSDPVTEVMDNSLPETPFLLPHVTPAKNPEDANNKHDYLQKMLAFMEELSNADV